MIQQVQITLPAFHRGFHLITSNIKENLPELPKQGILHLFIKHTSAGLTLNENADPTVRSDLERFMNDLIPENYRGFEHTMEGPDDMPAHIKASFFGSELSIPIQNHRLELGTWQGIYLCEFRNHGGSRKVVASIYS